MCCPLFIHKGLNLIAQVAWTLLESCQEVTHLIARGLEEMHKTLGVGSILILGQQILEGQWSWERMSFAGWPRLKTCIM